jgi:hypothetical protein
MNHNTIELPKSYYDNPKKYKTNKICRWKSSGVIYDDWDDLYEVYMNTMECQHCKKPFETSYDRCLDHNHETGLFRMILCQGCNNSDSHLRHSPEMTSEDKRKEYCDNHKEEKKEYNKTYREANKEKIKAQKKALYQAKKEKIKETRKAKYEANKDKILEQNKEYRDNHKEQRKVYIEANKEKIKSQKKALYQAKKEKLNKENQLK